MAISWVYKTQNTIYTIVKTRAKQQLADYPSVEFTTKSQTTDYTKFPTVYIHYLPSDEIGTDLEGDTVNGFTCGAQILVTVSKAQGEKGANEVMYAVLDEFKKLHFRVNLMPEFINTGNNDVIQTIARVRRAIGFNDIIN